MKLKAIAATLFAAATVLAAQASFAEESTPMQKRMHDLANVATQQQSAEQSASAPASEKDGAKQG